MTNIRHFPLPSPLLPRWLSAPKKMRREEKKKKAHQREQFRPVRYQLMACRKIFVALCVPREIKHFIISHWHCRRPGGTPTVRPSDRRTDRPSPMAELWFHIFKRSEYRTSDDDPEHMAIKKPLRACFSIYPLRRIEIASRNAIEIGTGHDKIGPEDHRTENN